MKRWLILSILLLAGATLVSAEQGALCLYPDAGGTACDFVDNGDMVQVYIVHSYADGVTASRFRLDITGTGWTHLSDLWNYTAVIGTSVGGVSIGYGGCETSPFVVGSAAFMGASAAPGTPIRIVPDYRTDNIQIVDCDGRSLIGSGGTAYVNSTTPCVCQANQAPALVVEPTGLDFGYIDTARVFTVINVGGGALTWNLSESIPWLELSTTGGTNTGDVTVTVDRTGLASKIYNGEIELTSNAGGANILVYMTVIATEPILRVVPASLTFEGRTDDKNLYVFNDGVAGMIWSITSDQPWMSVTPTSGLDQTEVAVEVDRTGLAVGTHTGSLSVVSNGGNQTVPVSVIVLPPYPILELSKTALVLTPTKTQRIVYLTNGGGVDLNWNITIDRTGLADGPYEGNLSVTSDGGNKIIPVDMWSGPLPILRVDPSYLEFTPTDTVATFEITNIGDGNLDWSLAADRPWIEIVPPLSGPNNATVTVNVHPDSLPSIAVYFGNIAVSSLYDTLNVGVGYVPPGMGQEGTIAIFSDPGATDYHIVDNGGLVQVYFFYVHHSGAKAARFKLDAVPGWVHMGDIWQFQNAVGNSIGGVFLQFGGCFQAPTYLGVANFFGNVAPVCSPIRIVADPASGTGQIMMIDCADVVKIAAGGTGYVNSDGSCGWGPIRQTTWGQIRAMFGPRAPEKSNNQ